MFCFFVCFICWCCFLLCLFVHKTFFFFYLRFLSRKLLSRFRVQHGKGEAISITPPYHFHLPHWHLDISGAITAESSPLHIASSRTRTGNLCFLSTSCWPLSQALKTYFKLFFWDPPCLGVLAQYFHLDFPKWLDFF